MTMPSSSGTSYLSSQNSGADTALNLADQVLGDLKSKKAEQQLSLWAHSNYRKAKSSRSILERQWYLNMAFYFGRQNVQILSTPASPNGFKLYTPPAPPWRVRLVSNKIRAYVRTDLARLTSQKPTFTVMPATTDDDALVAARVGEDLFEAYYHAKRVNRVIRRALFWTMITGNGFIKQWWDSAAVDKSSGVRGDVLIEHITPFHLLVPDLREEELEQQPFVIHASAKTVEWVQTHFPGKLKDLNPSTSVANDILQDSFLNMIGANTYNRDSILCLEVWAKPGVIKGLPNGGMFTVLGDELVQLYEGWPYKHGEYPFAKIEYVPSGKFYADSVINDLLPLQREYNRTRSQIVEAKNLMAKPKLLAPRGSVNANQITSEPGQVIYYQPGLNPPTPLQMAPLPQYVMDELKALQMDMDEISGQSEILRGQTSPNVSSATGFAFLQEQADVKLQSTYDSIEAALEKTGRQYLGLVSQYWDTGRIVKTVGPNESFDAQIFKGEDLKGNNDLRVEAGSSLPTSKAARIAMITEFMKMGFIQPQDGFSVLEMGGLEKLMQDVQIDQKQVRRENIKLSQGMEVPVNDWDNHQAHIAMHDQFRKSQQFEALPDEIKVLWDQHVQMHKMQLNGGGMPGMPGPVGGPGGMMGGPQQEQQPQPQAPEGQQNG